MKVGIVSDTHGDYDAWQIVAEYCFDEVDVIVHAGDLLYHGPRNPLVTGYDAQRLAEAFNGLKLPIYCARGNCDADVDQAVLQFPLMDPAVSLELAGKQVYIHHGHRPDLLLQAIDSGKYRLVVTGHTHQARLARTNGVVVINPGSPSLPKGQPPIPTVAVWEENQIAIVNIVNNEILEQISF